MGQVASEEILTAEEVAELLGVAVKTLYHWRRLKKGPASFRVGRHLRYRRSVIDGWIRRQEKQTA